VVKDTYFVSKRGREELGNFSYIKRATFCFSKGGPLYILMLAKLREPR